MQNNQTLLKEKWISVLLILTLSISPMGCNTSRAVKGGAIGAGSGAVVGGVIGKKAGNTALGAIIGAAVGGTAGALIGRYMDKQAEEIQRDLKGAKVERIGEGIKITFDSGLLFDVNKYNLKPASRSNLEELAQVLKKYEDTNILIEGHTDSSGSDEHNYELSDKRAHAVSGYLGGLGVNPTRFTVVGYGENQPVASNESESGRQQNRRVDIAIYANDKLKKAAKKGDIGNL